MLYLLLSYFGSTRAERIRMTVGICVVVALSIAAIKFLEGVAVLVTILGGAVVIGCVVFFRDGPEREKWNREMRRPLGSRTSDGEAIQPKRTKETE